MQWVIAFHIIFMVTWFSGLFYLPRLYVYHSMAEDEISRERFTLMERKLFFGIATPGGVLTTIFGIWLLMFDWAHYMQMYWLHAKLILVIGLWAYHLYCAKLWLNFKRGENPYTHVFFRFFNEIPTVILIAVIILTEVKPF